MNNSPYLNLPLRDEAEVRREREQRDAERLALWRENAREGAALYQKVIDMFAVPSSGLK